MILGLTGGSGTGKSTACNYFKKRGYIIVDSDSIAREVCSPGEPCLAEIAEHFGKEILDDKGNLIRPLLGDMVFADKEKLQLLNSITHKYIVDKNKEIIALNPGRNIVLDAPLLFEAGLGSICTQTLCVLSSREKRIERIVARDGILPDKAMARINSQPDDEFYISRCDYTVYNNAGVDELIKALDAIFGGNE